MSEKQAKRRRQHEELLRLRRENDRLTDLLLLKKPPLVCRIRVAIEGKSPSALINCKLGHCRRIGKCETCLANTANYFNIGFTCGYTGKPYAVIMAQEILKFYQEEVDDA